jgi:hypothetical protein
MDHTHPLVLAVLRELDDITVVDRVRQVTDLRAQERLDAELVSRIAQLALAPRQALTARISELEREWDVERVLEVNAALVGGWGVLLAVTGGRRWLVLPAAVTAFLFQHAIRGWCPPLELFRRMGWRTRREIDLELHAVKALRGDYDHLRARADGGIQQANAAAGH